MSFAISDKILPMVILYLVLFICSLAWAASPSVCDIIDSGSCYRVMKQVRRSSAVSLPSPAAAASTNPAAVSFDRGFGIEAIHQSGNSVNFNLASGTGKMGGALISHSMENSFFGNRTPETDDVYIERLENKKQYRPQKINLALGKSIIRKSRLSLDAGVMLKRHSEIKRINPGFGLSGRIGPLTWGASLYQDDFVIKPVATYYSPTGYTWTYKLEPYQEKFTVQAYTIGTRINYLTFDAGLIESRYELFDYKTKVSLYSMGLYYRNFLFNFGRRNEHSATPVYDYDTGAIKSERRKNENYAGVQVSLTRNIIVGIQYNFFLLRETSFTANLFF